MTNNVRAVTDVYNSSVVQIANIIGRRYTNSLTEDLFHSIAETTGLKNKSCAVLDIGCGNANVALWFAKHYDVTISGLDLSPAMVRIAQENIAREKMASRVCVSEGDFNTTKIVDRFDLVWAIDVAMYFEPKPD